MMHNKSRRLPMQSIDHTVCHDKLPKPPSRPPKTAWPWAEQTPALPKTTPNGSPWPRITVVTPSYNQAQFIEETIRSVLLQGYPNLEYIIMDGGSTDGTVEILRLYEPWLTDWVSGPDGGQASAVNKGWKQATGQILGWLNSDDCYLPQTLARVATAFYSNPQLRVLSGECLNVDASGQQKSIKRAHPLAPHSLVVASQPSQPATFIHASVLSEVGFLEETLHYALDREFLLRLARRYYPQGTATLDVPLAYAHEWEGTKSEAGVARHMQEYRNVIDAFLAGEPDERLRRCLRHRGHRHAYLIEVGRAVRSGRLAAAAMPLLRALYHTVGGYSAEEMLGLFIKQLSVRSRDS